MSRPKLRTLVLGLTLALLSGCGSSNNAATEAENSSAEAEVVTSGRVESSSSQPESTTTTIPEDDIEDLTESVHAEEETDDPLPSSTELSSNDETDNSAPATQTTVADTDDPSSEDSQETDDCCIGDITTPQEYLAMLTVADEMSRDGYDRSYWAHWHTKSWSGCSTREEVLVRTMIGEERSASGNPCRADAAWWYSVYDDTWTSNPSEFDIDHIVSLAEAHDSGAANWEADRKERFANDVTNLVAVSASSNRSKSDLDAAEWRPPKNYWCSFAHAVVEVKWLYSLSVDTAEYEALEEMIDTCTPMMSEPSNWWEVRTTSNVYYAAEPEAPQTTVASDTTSIPDATSTTSATSEATEDEPENPGDTKNCNDFETYSEAKTWFDRYFPLYGDVARLDGDNDGEPCESLTRSE